MKLAARVISTIGGIFILACVGNEAYCMWHMRRG